MDRKVITAPERTAPCEHVVIHGLTSGRTEKVKFDGKPSAEARRLAKFAVGVGWRLHRRVIAEPPEVRWFKARSAPGAVPRLGFADASYVALSDSLEGEQVSATSLHEVRHVGQLGIPFSDAAAEEDAAAFSRRWLAATTRAYRASRGELSRVSVTDKARPAGWAPHREVRLTKPNGKVWERNNRTTHEAWKELYT